MVFATGSIQGGGGDDGADRQGQGRRERHAGDRVQGGGDRHLPQEVGRENQKGKRRKK